LEDDQDKQMFKESLVHDANMKREIRRDHISEMYGGEKFKKEPIGSEFMEQYSKESLSDLKNIQMPCKMRLKKLRKTTIWQRMI
jgi:hypothetical protein